MEASVKLREIGEFGFIDRVKQGCLIRRDGVVKDIGDDCAVVRIGKGPAVLFTTDMLIEDVHFVRDAIPPDKLGRKSLAVNISDIAAMGGTPRDAVISIGIPGGLDVEYLDSFYGGMKAMAKGFGVNLLGGDTTSSPRHLVINVALIGEVPEDEILYRSGARAGDLIFLTGHVGSSAAGLDLLVEKRSFEGGEELLEAHFNPYPHVRAGRIIAGMKAGGALIDVSDGIASDLGHICRESKVGAVIEEEKIPVTERFLAYCAEFGVDRNRLTLRVGEDYVLLGTVPERSAGRLEEALKASACEFFPIGRVGAEPGIRLKTRDGALRDVEPGGYDHFKTRP
jgi:thiamine-monophosphate kinase